MIVLLAVILLAQVPFIYRRYQTGKLAQRIAELNASRPAMQDDGYSDLKGIIHAHTSLGGHSTGGFEELLAGARQNGLDFVVMTEHYSEDYDTSALTLNGYYGDTLFVGGNEVDTADGDRFLLIPGSSEAAAFRNVPTDKFLEKIHAEGRVALITYPEKFKTWDSAFDGIETYSLHTNAKRMNPLTAIFDMIWSYPAYPALTFATHFQRPDENLKRFDEIANRRRITMFGGTDAHSNIGFHLFGDDAGNKLINAKIDGYGTIFQIARVHILLKNGTPLTRESLTDAIRDGHFYTGFDVIGETTGFRFTAENAGGEQIMGDEIAAEGGVKLSVRTPIATRIVIFRNGEVFREAENAAELTVDAAEAGVYRVEAYQNALGAPFDKMPWIISNPIYVR